MDKRLITQWEAERLPEREEAYKADVLEYALAHFQATRDHDNPTPYQEYKYQAYALMKTPEIE